MTDIIGIVITMEESQMLLKALVDCKGVTQVEEEHLNALYMRVIDAQILTTRYLRSNQK